MTDEAGGVGEFQLFFDVAAIRNRNFTFLRGLVIEAYEAALANLSPITRPSATLSPSAGERDGVRGAPLDADGEPWTAARLQQLMNAYHAGHDHPCLDPNARNVRHTYVTPSEDKRILRVQQMLVDPEGDNDWVAEFEVDLTESRKSGEPPCACAGSEV